MAVVAYSIWYGSIILGLCVIDNISIVVTSSYLQSFMVVGFSYKLFNSILIIIKNIIYL